jgi:hypothetical protein
MKRKDCRKKEEIGDFSYINLYKIETRLEQDAGGESKKVKLSL